MEKILYQDETQTLLEIKELIGGGKRFEVHIDIPVAGEEPEHLIIPMFAAKKSNLPKMPLKSWDTITWPCCNMQHAWVLDSDGQFWLRLGKDKWDETDPDYLLWLMEDIFKKHRNKVREASGMEVE